MDSSPTPELLAPAGTIGAGLAALDAGADAIYAGLPRFNARERAENCSMDDLSKLIAYAHRASRRVYVTLNTLIKDSETEEVADLLAELSLIRPDAVIVQDLGIVHMIREHFPALSIHASTQMGIHNSAGVRAAARMGISRVILERQVTYEEIERIQASAPIELEVFVHGALCCSRSGVCLFSSWMGGWSGNRGKCKQPCRRRYHTPGGNGFFFSTRDLFSLDAIPRLRAMQIASLKIEGRLRRPDYVRRVVAAYRLLLDCPYTDSPAAIREARALIAAAPGRKWTGPFLTGADFAEVIDHRSLGAAGRFCGRVLETGSDGFLVELSRTIRINDSVRVQPASGDEGPAFILTRLSLDGRSVTSARKGRRCWIHCDKPVTRESLLIKTGRLEQHCTQRIAAMPTARPAVDLEITLADDELAVRPPVGGTWRGTLQTSPAKRHPLSPDSLANEFRHTRSARLACGRVAADIPRAVFVPASRIKSLRRAFWEWADTHVSPDELRRMARAGVRKSAGAARQAVGPAATPTTVVRVESGGPCPVPRGLAAHGIGAWGDRTDELVLPDFCPEAELAQIELRIAAAYEHGVRRFRVTSLYGFELLEKYADIHRTASFPIPVCNTHALRELGNMRTQQATAWVELDRESLSLLREKNPGQIEVFAYGRIPVLSTRFRVPATGIVTDSRGARFSIVRDGEMTHLLPDKVMSVPTLPGTSVFIDLSHADLDEPRTDSFNYSRSFV